MFWYVLPLHIHPYMNKTS